MDADRGGERMQRVRIGLTGLACVFLLVLLAAAFFGLTNDEQVTGPLAATTPNAPADNGAMPAAPREPLAELGVAPGYSTDSGGNAAAPPPPAARTVPGSPTFPPPAPR